LRGSTRFALESLVLETEGKPDGVSDRVPALGLKENTRSADVTRGADPIVQLHGSRNPIAFSLSSLLKTAGPSHSAA
jgi:hypothetical protein